MRSSLIFLSGAALAVAAPNPQLDGIPDLNSIAAQLPSLVAQLGPAISAGVEQLGPALSSLGGSIPGLSPTAVVSDLPAVLASDLPALESYAIGLIPSGAVPSPYLAQISSAAPAVFSNLAQDIDSFIAQLPQTLPVTALPSYLSANLPAIESEILSQVSALIPAASSALTSVEAEITGGALPGSGSAGTTGGFPGTATATATGFSGALTPTASAPVQTFTGAANPRTWGKEVAGVAAAAGVIAAII